MKNIVVLFLLIFSISSFAQNNSKEQKDSFLQKANKEYESKKYADAESNYRISVSKFQEKATSAYNLGNTIYSINQPSEAKFAYAKAIEKAKTRPEKHKAFHNLGNVYMKEKKYSEAVNAYKNALVNNPKDDETRYNYALAKQLLKDNPPPPQDENKKDKQGEKDQKEKDKDKNKDDKGDNKDQNKDQKNQDNKDPEDKNDGKGDQKKDKDQDQGNQQQQPKQGGISKQQLESLLEAVNNEEKKVQDKVNVKKVKGQPVKREKEW